MATSENLYVIVRGAASGVFAGELESLDGTVAVIRDARRIWYWDGAASLSELAVYGPSRPENCKFPVKVPRIKVLDTCEVLECTPEGRKCLESVPVWSART
jgi:hypothetical protein